MDSIANNSRDTILYMISWGINNRCIFLETDKAKTAALTVGFKAARKEDGEHLNLRVSNNQTY